MEAKPLSSLPKPSKSPLPVPALYHDDGEDDVCGDPGPAQYEDLEEEEQNGDLAEIEARPVKDDGYPLGLLVGQQLGGRERGTRSSPPSECLPRPSPRDLSSTA